MTKVYFGLALAVLGALGVSWAHHAWVEEGRALCEAEHAKAETKAQVEQDRRSTASAEATTNMLDYLARNLPPIETTSHATIERVRTIYRDHPVDGVCTRPAGVQDELNAARDRANAAARAVPSGTSKPTPSHP